MRVAVCCCLLALCSGAAPPPDDRSDVSLAIRQGSSAAVRAIVERNPALVKSGDDSALTPRQFDGQFVSVRQKDGNLSPAVRLFEASHTRGLITPAADFVTTFCAFPRARSISDGSGVSVMIVRGTPSGDFDRRAGVARLVTGAAVTLVSQEAWLAGSVALMPPSVVLLAEAPAPEEPDRALTAVKALTDRGVVVVVPAYFGPMRAGADLEAWRAFVRRASERGAVIAGMHGRAYQVGNLEYWKAVPVDVFAVHPDIDGDDYGYADSAIDADMARPAASVAAAAALLRSHMPRLNPAEVRRAFRERGRHLYWMAARWSVDPSRVRVRPMPAGRDHRVRDVRSTRRA